MKRRILDAAGVPRSTGALTTVPGAGCHVSVFCRRLVHGVWSVSPDLFRGRVRGYDAVEAAGCVACGATIAPGTMLKRIEALLGQEHAGSMPVIGRYCTGCRGTGAYRAP